jgi:SPOR domain
MASAQNGTTVTVHKDPRMDALVKKQIEVNEYTTRDARRNVPGFRLLILTSNDRNKVTDAKLKVYKNFPELKAYVVYQAPYYKLRVGNFKDQKEANDYLKKVELYFPTGVYVIRDIIEVNPDKSSELDK